MASGTQRNELCPCGSGKKYKKCCLLKEQTTRPLSREVLGQACRQAISLLMEYALSTAKPLEAPPLGRPIPELPDEATQDSFEHELVTPWLLYHWVPPDSREQAIPSERTVAARFLKQEADGLDGITRRFIEAARLEPFSYWQVESVSPGSGVLLKDLVTGEERSVADLSISRSASPWDIFFAQVVGIDGMYIFNGLGVYSLSPDRFRLRIDEFATDIGRRVGKAADRISLLEHQTEFMNHYLHFVDEILNPRMPELVNMDGDKLVLAKSRFSFLPAQREGVMEALGKLRDVHEEDDKDGAAKFVWVAKPKSKAHQDEVVKGIITVGPDWLECECNSEARDRALRRRLLRPLGASLTHENTNLKPFHPGMAAAGKSPESDQEDSGKLDLSTLSPKDRTALEAVLEQKYMAWLDTEVPMLGGKTPRQTARTPQGKARVAAMINDWENMQNRRPNPQFQFDFNKLRAELQIAPE